MENASFLQHETSHQSSRISSNKSSYLKTPGAFHYRRLISRSTAICINIVSKEVLKIIENYFETYLVVETVILNYNFSASSKFQSWIGRN